MDNNVPAHKSVMINEVLVILNPKSILNALFSFPFFADFDFRRFFGFGQKFAVKIIPTRLLYTVPGLLGLYSIITVLRSPMIDGR